MSIQREDLLRSILDANEVYASAFAQADPALLKKLAKGQSPRICWLGCSDSRVSAELSTGVAPGSIFVHRNVAQCFHEGDLSAAAALSYAVNVLQVEAIIVCGHTGCGGVKAAMMAAQDEKANGPATPANEHERIVSKWISPIKDLALTQLEANSSNGELRDHKHENGCSHGGAEYDCLSATALGELTDKHVAETVKAVAESQIVTEAWKEGRQLSVHGWVYHVATARLRDLDIGWKGVGIPADSLSRPGSFAGSETSEHLVASDDEA
ncbi:carbonic anhydrase [Leucosporidium creatinivorum]|uniref:Carbonic anhydrase n=1 Tax=Leucosporidium creatinivorum TaxID=106004 RepID=A0A1Y2FA96_9BASI|nr:carbonic anhydrase [Leucosporidium creatinivorum]